MAKKTEPVNNMVDHFAEFKEHKNIDKTTMISVLEESFRNVIAKMFGTDENFDVIMNPDKGDCEIYQNLEVVADDAVENNVTQIGLTAAREIDPECEIGEDVTKRIYFENFGRRAILNLRQTLQSKILDLQKDAIYSKFKELEGEVVSGEVHQIWKKEMLLIDEDQNELIMPKEEQIPGDFFHKGDVVRAVVKRVDNPNNNPKVIVSRTDERFLRRLFEQEVPEVHDGLITIKSVARIPGKRAKIAVESYDDRIDPVGACVGIKEAVSTASCANCATRTSTCSTTPPIPRSSYSAPSPPPRSARSASMRRKRRPKSSCTPRRYRSQSERRVSTYASPR